MYTIDNVAGQCVSIHMQMHCINMHISKCVIKELILGKLRCETRVSCSGI